MPVVRSACDSTPINTPHPHPAYMATTTVQTTQEISAAVLIVMNDSFPEMLGSFYTL